MKKADYPTDFAFILLTFYTVSFFFNFLLYFLKIVQQVKF